MERDAMRCLLLLLVSITIGCSSTPYSDDHVQHVNSVDRKILQDKKVTFSLSDAQLVDLRGKYRSNDTIGQSTIMYQGGAGLIGLLAQIGTHAAIVNSSRNGKLSLAQEQANEQVKPLLDLTKEMTVLTLLGKYSSELLSAEAATKNTLIVRPIFFSNSEMNQLSLKLVAWIPSEQKGRKKKFLYQNIVEVYGSSLDDTERQSLLLNTDDMLTSKLSKLLQTAMHVVSNDLKGIYDRVDRTNKTYFIKEGTQNKVVRGSLVEENCGYYVIQDLHSWLIAFPAQEATENYQSDLLEQC
jgi:hypothetical protein